MTYYHSALRPELSISGTLERFESNGSIVFQHDLTSGFHTDFGRAGAVYSEPAWRAGYASFIKRAGAGSDPGNDGFLRYLAIINNIIRGLGVPAYVIVGRHMLAHLKPDRVQPIYLHGDAMLATWNVPEAPLPCQTNEEVIQYVAGRYDNVLDFSCGYGNLAQAMLERGKHFICSDINSKCVYYVAKTLMGYEG